MVGPHQRSRYRFSRSRIRHSLVSPFLASCASAHHSDPRPPTSNNPRCTNFQSHDHRRHSSRYQWREHRKREREKKTNHQSYPLSPSERESYPLLIGCGERQSWAVKPLMVSVRLELGAWPWLLLRLERERVKQK